MKKRLPAIFSFALFILCVTQSSAQIFTYSKNGLQVEVTVKNACDSAVSNGSITFKLISSASKKAQLLLISGPSTTVFPEFDFQLPDTTTFTFVPASPQNGTYDFVIRDPLNNSDFINTLIASVNGVNLGALPPIVLSQSNLNNNTNCNTPNGQIQATLSGGSKSPALTVAGSFSYTWTSSYPLPGLPLTGSWDGTGTLDLANLLSIPGLPGGKYTLQVSDNYSQCSEQKEYIILDSSPVEFNVAATNLTGCINTDLTIQLTGSESSIVEYEVLENGNPTGIKKTGISGPLSFIVPGARFTTDGTYVYTILATNGICTPLLMLGSTTVTVNKKIEATSVVTPTSCNGAADGTLSATATGGTGPYEFSLNNGISFQTSGNFSGLSAGDTTLIIKDSSGCQVENTITISQPLIVGFIATPDQVSCNGSTDGDISIAATGGNGGYVYSIDNGTTFQTSNQFKDLVPGTYSVVVKDSKNCLSPAQNSTVIEPAVLSVSTTKQDVTVCDPGNDGSLTASVTGGTGPFSYSIDGSTFQTSPTFSGLKGGLYVVTVLDSRGCSEFVTTTIDVPAGPLFFFSIQDLKCFNDNSGKIDVTGFGGTSPLQYSANGGTTFQSTGNFSNLSAGQYKLVVKDSKGCKFEINTSLFQPAEIVPNISSTPVLCNGESNGTISITTTSGNLPLEYSINNGVNFSSNGSFSNLSSGNYTILIKDSQNCFSSPTSFNLANPSVLQLSSAITNATCSNNDGKIQIVAVGGTPPYRYEFNNAAVATLPAGGLFQGLTAGSYSIKVIDSRNCSSTKSVDVSFPGNIAVTATGTPPDCNGNGTNGFITVNLTTVGNYQAGLSSNPPNEPQGFLPVTNGTFNFSNLTNGTYAITIRHNSLCPAILPVTLSGGPVTVAFTSEVIEKLCFEDRSFVRLSGIKGNPSLNYKAEIRSGASVYKTQIITPTAASNPVEVEIPDAGAYELIFSQDQSSATPCSNPITLAPVAFSLDAPGALLDITDLNKTISLPDLPTGSLSGTIVESTEEPYETKLELIVPHEPGQSFLSDFELLNRNSETGKVEFNYSKIFAGDYAFSLKDSFGCLKTYDITIDFDPKLFIPNIFTPDGDGINEEFYIRNLPPNSDLQITDSWGQRVFSSGNYQNDWTGKGVPNGVYYYRLTIGRKNYTGWVEILNGK